MKRTYRHCGKTEEHPPHTWEGLQGNHCNGKPRERTRFLTGGRVVRFLSQPDTTAYVSHAHAIGTIPHPSDVCRDFGCTEP